MAKNVHSQAKKNQTTIENEVQKQINAHRARKKIRVDQGARAAQADEELWGHTSSDEEQVIPQTSYLESADNLLYPVQFDQIFQSDPLNTSDYTSSLMVGPSYSFQPLFPSILTRPRGSKVLVNPPVIQSTLETDSIEADLHID